MSIDGRQLPSATTTTNYYKANPIGWLLEWWMVDEPVHRSIGWFIDCSVSWLFGWLVSLVIWLVWLIRLVGWLVGWFGTLVRVA
jgi:hypothetical protein